MLWVRFTQPVGSLCLRCTYRGSHSLRYSQPISYFCMRLLIWSSQWFLNESFLQIQLNASTSTKCAPNKDVPWFVGCSLIPWSDQPKPLCVLALSRLGPGANREHCCFDLISIPPQSYTPVMAGPVAVFDSSSYYKVSSSLLGWKDSTWFCPGPAWRRLPWISPRHRGGDAGSCGHWFRLSDHCSHSCQVLWDPQLSH